MSVGSGEQQRVREKVSVEHPVFTPGSINEPKEHWVVHALKTLGLVNFFAIGQAGVLTALVLVAGSIVNSTSESSTKIAGVTIVVMALAVLGMANILAGKSNGTSSTDKADQSAHPGTSGGSS